MKDDCAEIGERAVANWKIEGLGIAVVLAVNRVLQMRKFQKPCQALCRGQLPIPDLGRAAARTPLVYYSGSSWQL